MKIAFIVGRFPVLSEAFILNQIAGLLDRGHQLDIYALEGYSGETKIHPIVDRYNLLEWSRYVPSIPDNFALRCLKAIKLLLTQGGKHPLAVLRSLNFFQYGKQAASLRLFYGAIAFLEQPEYDIVHCQFGIILDHSQIFIASCVTAKDGNQDAPVNTLKEAMAMGLPVISTYHGGIPELVQDGVSGYLVAERDFPAIADLLQHLIANPQLWQDLGKQGSQFVREHYDINQLNDDLVTIYQKCLAGER